MNSKMPECKHDDATYEDPKAIKIMKELTGQIAAQAKEIENWKEEARRYCSNADFWKAKAERMEKALRKIRGRCNFCTMTAGNAIAETEGK